MLLQPARFAAGIQARLDAMGTALGILAGRSPVRRRPVPLPQLWAQRLESLAAITPETELRTALVLLAEHFRHHAGGPEPDRQPRNSQAINAAMNRLCLAASSGYGDGAWQALRTLESLVEGKTAGRPG